MRSKPTAASRRAPAPGSLSPLLRALVLQAACVPFAPAARAQSTNGTTTNSTAAAPNIGEPGERVWAAAAFVLPGDSTPLAQSAALTPLGARQLFDQGAAFRARYLGDASAASHIVGIEPSFANATQLTVAAGSEDAYSAAGALAFLQGLYPPVRGAGGDGNESSPARLANGSVIDSPLGGYQYLSVATSSSSDEAYIWLDGRSKCDAHRDLEQSQKKNASIVDIYDKTLSFYTSLWKPLFDPVFSLDEASFYSAYALWDYAEYRWTHENATRELMTQADLDRLAALAAEQQWYANADLTPGSANDEAVRAIAGRTLASRVYQGLSDSISRSGAGGKLILSFVPSAAPLVAFFALAGLDTASSEDFSPTAMPGPGAAMVFELFSPAGVTGNAYPSREDLRVRFLYRNGTEGDAALRAYSIFGGSSGATGMRWDDFAASMQKAGVADAGAWCKTCRVGAEGFCAQYMFGGGRGLPHDFERDGEGPLNATTGGIIGAAVTLGALGLLAILSALYQGGKKRWRENVLRGGEKLVGDDDEAIPLGGLQRQRVENLELQSGARGPGGVEQGVLAVPRSMYGSLKKARTRAGDMLSSGSRRTAQGHAVIRGKQGEQDTKGVDSGAAVLEGQRPTTPRDMLI